jgi:hypothetical protein
MEALTQGSAALGAWDAPGRTPRKNFAAFMKNSSTKSKPDRRPVTARLMENAHLIDPPPPLPEAAPKVKPVTIAHRWPRPLVDALIEVSAARKVARQKPWLQQEITAEAMREWLERHGPKQGK